MILMTSCYLESFSIILLYWHSIYIVIIAGYFLFSIYLVQALQDIHKMTETVKILTTFRQMP